MEIRSVLYLRQHCTVFTAYMPAAPPDINIYLPITAVDCPKLSNQSSLHGGRRINYGSCLGDSLYYIGLYTSVDRCPRVYHIAHIMIIVEEKGRRLRSVKRKWKKGSSPAYKQINISWFFLDLSQHTKQLYKQVVCYLIHSPLHDDNANMLYLETIWERRGIGSDPPSLQSKINQVAYTIRVIFV